MRDETRRQEGQEDMDAVGQLVDGGREVGWSRYLEELSGLGEMAGRGVDGVMGAARWCARCLITRGRYLLVSKRPR